MAYAFGPVPSRRLGLSLGIDVVPYKVCSFDCVYCQLGTTTHKTSERQAFVDIEDVIAELREVVPCVKADYITLSGSGEPALSLDIGRLIREIKKLTSTPVAVLTNGSLLSRPDLRQELLGADLVIPSLDAGSQEVFEKMNRPCPGLCLDRIIDGLDRFSRNYRGKMWVEVMVVKGINDSEEELERVKDYFDDRAELIVSAGPMGVPGASKESVLTVDEGRQLASPTAKCGTVLNLLRRRPCTLADVATGLNINMNEASKLIGVLINEGLVNAIRRDDGLTYFGYVHHSE